MRDLRWLRIARRIGMVLRRRAWHDASACNWVAHELEPADERWQLILRSLDGSVYRGTAGIARFLVQLWRGTGEPWALELAFRAVNHSKRAATSQREQADDGEAAMTAAELAAVLVEVAGACRSRNIHDSGRRLAADAVARLATVSDRMPPDYVGGLAGALAALCFVARRTGDAVIADGCGTLARALAPHAPSLCGLAHGASGLALALMEASVVAADGRLGTRARRAVEWETAWFEPRRGNWPDLRTPPGSSAGDVYPLHWCHGGVGIGLARLRLYELTGDGSMRAQALAALQTAHRAAPLWLAGIRTTVDANLSVCHGVGGLIELLVQAYAVLGHRRSLDLARTIGAEAARRAAAQRWTWPCGVPDGGEHPGLLLGLAGIGLSYLRLYDPGSFPPVSLWTH